MNYKSPYLHRFEIPWTGTSRPVIANKTEPYTFDGVVGQAGGVRVWSRSGTLPSSSVERSSKAVHYPYLQEELYP
jgi:hypothetical protein